MLKKLYNWVLSWAESPYGTWALFILSFTESSFFPIPPDVLLIALCIAKPKKSFFYVAICSLGSVLGGMFGYSIGMWFMDIVGLPIIKFYHLETQFDSLQKAFHANDILIVWLAGFTPIPYKLCTITAGMTKINFPIFVFASLISRTARFLILGTLLYFQGQRIKIYIDKYFNILTIAFAILLIAGFVVIKLL